jgi:hypothetical protein
MLFEHWIYSIAIAIIVGMIYYKFTSRDYSWIIIASAYAPDVDMIADTVLKKIGITVLIYGNPVSHGDFHNIAVLLVYAVSVALLLHPIGIKLVDSFFFAGMGFAAHMFEDALIASPAYPFLWPLSYQRFGIGIFNYTRDWYGIANEEVLIIGIIGVVICAILRTAYEGTGWIKRFIFISHQYLPGNSR